MQPKTSHLPRTAGVEKIFPGKSLLHNSFPSRMRMQRTPPEAVVYQALAPLRAKPATMLLPSRIFQISFTAG